MNLQQKVTNLELSQKLKSLGYPQMGAFWWSDGELCYDSSLKGTIELLFAEKEKDVCVAPLTCELGEWLLAFILDDEDQVFLDFEKIDDDWFYSYPGFKTTKDKTEANCRAKMLIWLVEQGYVEFEK